MLIITSRIIFVKSVKYGLLMFLKLGQYVTEMYLYFYSLERDVSEVIIKD